MFAHLNPHSSYFGDISALYSPFLHQLTVQSSLFEPRCLQPCPSYSRRRDRITLGLLRSLYKVGGGGGYKQFNPGFGLTLPYSLHFHYLFYGRSGLNHMSLRPKECRDMPTTGFSHVCVCLSNAWAHLVGAVDVCYVRSVNPRTPRNANRVGYSQFIGLKAGSACGRGIQSIRTDHCPLYLSHRGRWSRALPRLAVE